MHNIYLSPSNQFNNKYAYGNTTEGTECNEIAAYCKTALERCGFRVMVAKASDSMRDRCADSNLFHAELHIPIHTNAFNGSVMGTRLFCMNKTGAGFKACAKIMETLSPITPGESDSITANPNLYEVKHPNAPTAYVEVGFHDTQTEAKWIVEHKKEIGEAICQGVCRYFGVTYIEEVPTSTIYRVQVGAFRVKENAEKMLDELALKGYAGFIVEGKV